MKRTIKKWAGIALPTAIILLLLVQRDREDARMKNVWQQKYRRIRMQIGWKLISLRHDYGARQSEIPKNTALEIRELWDERDVLFYVLYHRKNTFPADSLTKLQRLIDRHAPLTTVFREIERIEKINENNQP